MEAMKLTVTPAALAELELNDASEAERDEVASDSRALALDAAVLADWRDCVLLRENAADAADRLDDLLAAAARLAVLLAENAADAADRLEARLADAAGSADDDAAGDDVRPALDEDAAAREADFDSE